MYTCILTHSTDAAVEGMLIEMSHLIESFINVIMDHMCISTKRADGEESYLDNFKMMSIVFAFLSGCVMNKVCESGNHEIVGFDVPVIESGS